MAPVVLVHGGAGDIPESRVPLKIQGIQKAALEGYRVLQEKGSVLDAVEAAIKIMEDDEAFNAGKGSVLTELGTIEMDAIIMEGAMLKAGAVAGVTEIANPITAARLVMTETPHVMLVGPAAIKFAHSKGIPYVPEEDLITDYARQALDDFLHGGGQPTNELGHEQEGRHGTVGAVAVDSDGHVACATSTGGMTGKMPGRVGDTPLIGAGGYCDDKIGACSATGHGETIARVCLCRHITGLMESGISTPDAVRRALEYMEQRTGGTGGAIAVSSDGQVGFHFTSKRMAWAYVQNQQLHYGINAGDHFIQPLP